MSHTVQFITLGVATALLDVGLVVGAVWLVTTVRRYR